MALVYRDRPRFLLLTILAAAAGLALCLLHLAGSDLPCLTAGCSIYGDYRLFGLPVYGYGAVGFAIILALALATRRNRKALPLLGLTMFGALVVDALFLGWQVLYWPCLNCLYVAVLLGLAALGCLLAFAEFRGRIFLAVLGLWLLVFIPVLIAVGKEVALPPWPLAGPDDAAIRVFFSPTCKACATTVEKILDSPSLTSQTVFFPVAKDEEDLRRLAGLLQSGPPEAAALRQLFTPGQAGATPGRELRLRLAGNRMALARMGEDTLPLVLSRSVVEVQPALFPSGELGNEPLFVPGFQEHGCSAVATQAEDCP